MNECFLWKDADEADRDEVKAELADVLIYSIMLADKYGFDIHDICMEKMEANAMKYPVDKARGTAEKYTRL